MNQRMQDVLMCPICIEMLQPPVVTLPCQHNLCRVCLEDMCAQKALSHSCPICRHTIVLGPNGLDDFPRNLIVEQLLDEHHKFKRNDVISAHDVTQSEESKSVAKVLGNVPSRELVVKFEKVPSSDPWTKNPQPSKTPPAPVEPKPQSSAQKFTPKPELFNPKAAIELHKKLEDGFKKLQQKIEIVNTLIRHEDYSLAAYKSDELAAIATDLPLQELHCEEATKEVRNLAKEMCRKDQYTAAVSLLYSASKLCERIPNPEVKMEELMFCADAMQSVATGMKSLQIVTQFKQHAVPVLNDIWIKMSRVANADPESKAIKSTWCLRHIAMCYNNIGDHEQALENNKAAIQLMQDQFGAYSSQYRILGICYHNLATGHRQLGTPAEAERIYLMALECYNKARDWPSEERKRRSVVMTTTALAEIGRSMTAR